MNRLFAMLLCLMMVGPVSESVTAAGFELQDDGGTSLDVLLDGKIVARYMYAYDTSTEDTLHETYKPYLHVFDSDGKSPITKGPYGKYTHHRGIFIGWSKMRFKGERYDRWHMKGGEIVHQKFLKNKSGANRASIVSVTHWNDNDGTPMVRETRTMTFRRVPAPARLSIMFTAELEAPNGDVFLGGDPEHAGIQYRPADEVVKTETIYVFPKEHANPKTDTDYPWVGETYTLNGKRYSVVHMNHPDNPKGTKYSAYRDYGRFGAFFEKEIKSGESLKVQYRFLIADGEMPTVEYIQGIWDRFIGDEPVSAVPSISITQAVNKKAKKK